MDMENVFVCRILQCCAKQKRTQKQIEELYKRKYPPSYQNRDANDAINALAILDYLVQEKHIKKEIVGTKDRFHGEGVVLYFVPTKAIERLTDFVRNKKNL